MMEAQLAEHQGCAQVAAAIVGNTSSAHLPLWVKRIVEKHHVLVQAKKERRERQPDDPLLKPVLKRETLLADKAREILKKLNFRTTKSNLGHLVDLWEVSNQPSASGTYKKAREEEEAKGKKAFADLQQVVLVGLNPKMWARVLKNCSPVVNGLFVLRILKVWSKNDLEVEVVQQSTGYSVRTRKKRIRRGNDGVWRVHLHINKK